MSGDITIDVIAKALGLTKRAAELKAKAKRWLYITKVVRGGKQNLYAIGSLPEDIAAKVMTLLARDQDAMRDAIREGTALAAKIKLATAIDERAAEQARQVGLAQFMTLPEPAKRRAEARAALVEISAKYIAVAGLPQRQGRETFATEYNRGAVTVPDWVRAARPSVSANSLDNWTKALRQQGLSRLGGRQGLHRKGSGIIDSNADLKGLVLGMLYEKPHISAELIMKAIKARFVEDLHPSERSLQRWLAKWKSENQQLFTAVQSPDAWRSKYMAAFGDADAKIIRPNQRWEADSTKADLLLNDGQRHVIVGIIDVYTRRLKLWVSRSSSSAAVASTMRRALLDWGVPEQFGTDNGSDYVSAHMLRVIAGLGILHDIAPPYTPDHKSFIERSFGTFCRDMVEMLPGYAGHNVADAQALRSRQSFAQRMMQEGGEKIELRMSPQDLQEFCNKWTETIYALAPHDGLKGKTPWQMVAEWPQPLQRIQDARSLDVLLAASPRKDPVTIGKKGIRFDNAFYGEKELGGLEGQQVTLLFDEADIGALYVFRLNGEFLCRAICPEREGTISRSELAAGIKASQKKRVAEGKAALKAMAKKANTDEIVADIFRAAAEKAGKLVALPRPSLDYTTDALEQAGLAARAQDVAAPAAPLSPEDLDRAAKVQAALEPAKSAEIVTLHPGRPIFEDDGHRLVWLAADTNRVTAADRSWLAEKRARNSSIDMLYADEIEIIERAQKVSAAG